MVMGNRRHTLSLHILEEDLVLQLVCLTAVCTHTMKTDSQSVITILNLLGTDGKRFIKKTYRHYCKI